MIIPIIIDECMYLPCLCQIYENKKYGFQNFQMTLLLVYIKKQCCSCLKCVSFNEQVKHL